MEPKYWVAAESLQLAHHNHPAPPPIERLTEKLPQTSRPNTFPYKESAAFSLLPPPVPQGKDKILLGYRVPPGTATRMTWVPSQGFTGLDVDTPVLVVNGERPGKTLCITAAVHGDELNGIEMVRQIMYGLNPSSLRGTVVGVPIVNLLAFGRNSRYLPDRRDLNRHFPGSPNGSLASRFAYSFFNDIVRHCDALVDLHTGSFHRTNLTQVRADLSHTSVYDLAHAFGYVVVLNTSGNDHSLRSAAVSAGIPTVTMEAGEPLRMQKHIVREGVEALKILLKKRNMIDHSLFWREPEPAFYQSTWVRSQDSGILFSRVKLGANVVRGDILGTITNPVTSEQATIKSPYAGKIIGMALDQFVLPGFASYHIGIVTKDKDSLPTAHNPDQDSLEDE
ncbi:MAG: succinylglutamate desuccinylase/aspartoacylase family protein [Marinagarivorans sp.]|nr:succinylglutamate desuccinylase/aspartoacylase family protein [Marinagarivorans sp.]